MNNEEIKNEFINCIEGTHTLNLAISVLEDREEYKKEIERLNKELENLEKLNNANYQSFIETNNIVNTLEKELREDYKIWMCNSRSNGKSVKFGIDVCKTHFYNRLQELKRM